jgi:hypothetical protein
MWSQTTVKTHAAMITSRRHGQIMFTIVDMGVAGEASTHFDDGHVHEPPQYVELEGSCSRLPQKFGRQPA